MRVSAAGRRMIEEFEGCRLTAYSDAVGVLTIGYGCTGAGVSPGMTISQAEADQMLADRLANEFEPGVLRAIDGDPTTQAQFDAMVSLCFNIGVGAFRGSTVVRKHCDGDYEGAADAFLMWNKAGGRVLAGLVRRRTAERALYLSDDAEPEEDGPQPAAADSRGVHLFDRIKRKLGLAIVLLAVLSGCVPSPAHRPPSVCVYPAFTMTLPDGAPCP